MIRVQHRTRTSVKVTFSVPVDVANGKVSVVGDFNEWDPLANPLRKRGDVMTTSVVLPTGGRHTFRFLGEGGRWLEVDGADYYEPNEYGTSNAVIDLSRERAEAE